MSRYAAEIHWERNGAVYRDGRYSRLHEWRFDGGITVPASAAVENAPPGCAVAVAVDPEEAFIAALSSCHMLFFLFFAAREGALVDEYCDRAYGLLEKDGGGGEWMTRVVLRPAVTYACAAPLPEQEAHWHERAHDACFIAKSVKTEVLTEIQPARVAPVTAPGDR